MRMYPPEPKCSKVGKPFLKQPKHFEHYWQTSKVNGLEMGYCSVCGLLRVRPYQDYANTAHVTALAHFSYHYYKPCKN